MQKELWASRTLLKQCVKSLFSSQSCTRSFYLPWGTCSVLETNTKCLACKISICSPRRTEIYMPFIYAIIDNGQMRAEPQLMQTPTV